MHQFLLNHRDDLIERCRAKVAMRPTRAATPSQLANGVPMFLDQLTRTLVAEGAGLRDRSLEISGSSGGDAARLSEIGLSATAHGAELMRLGFTIDAVVHDYGDLCQAITDLALVLDAPFTVDEFRMLNRCLDNAIADAVSEFAAQSDARADRARSVLEDERLGELVHELRNLLQSATFAFQALESGLLPVGGATGTLLGRNLASMATMLATTMAGLRGRTIVPNDEVFSVAELVAEAAQAARLDAVARGCPFHVATVDPFLGVSGNRATILAALANLPQNAFKFTHAHTSIGLATRADGERIFIEVSDHCGGLAQGALETMFRPFTQSGADRSGLGLGLSIARRGVEACGGTLTACDVPDVGCMFTIDMPQRALH